MKKDEALVIADTSLFHEYHDVEETSLAVTATQWKCLTVLASSCFITTVIFIAGTTHFISTRSEEKHGYRTIELFQVAKNQQTVNFLGIEEQDSRIVYTLKFLN